MFGFPSWGKNKCKISYAAKVVHSISKYIQIHHTTLRKYSVLLKALFFEVSSSGVGCQEESHLHPLSIKFPHPPLRASTAVSYAPPPLLLTCLQRTHTLLPPGLLGWPLAHSVHFPESKLALPVAMRSCRLTSSSTPMPHGIMGVVGRGGDTHELPHRATPILVTPLTRGLFFTNINSFPEMLCTFG